MFDKLVYTAYVMEKPIIVSPTHDRPTTTLFAPKYTINMCVANSINDKEKQMITLFVNDNDIKNYLMSRKPNDFIELLCEDYSILDVKSTTPIMHVLKYFTKHVKSNMCLNTFTHQNTFNYNKKDYIKLCKQLKKLSNKNCKNCKI